MAPALRCCAVCGAVYNMDFERCANDGAELVLTNVDPLLRTVVGSYFIDELLGFGGMGRVYRAHHQHLVHKHFALKVLLGDLAATQTTRRRFEREAEAASWLHHPNVVNVVDFGHTDRGLMYLVMELVHGRTLTELGNNTPMAPRRVIDLARGMCNGLAHAHEMGLVHRDFKPDNILVVERDGVEVPRIVDFGLVITRDPQEARLTESGFVVGTAEYIAPEQCLRTELDHRVDLYALGVTLFELLTGGVLPFSGPAALQLGHKTTRTAPTIEERAPDIAVPPALSAIVTRLLERRPEDRFPDARSVIAALDQVTVKAPRRAREHDTIVSDDHPDTDKIRRVGRRGALAATGAALVVAALGLAIALRASKQTPVANAQPVAAPAADEQAVASCEGSAKVAGPTIEMAKLEVTRTRSSSHVQAKPRRAQASRARPVVDAPPPEPPAAPHELALVAPPPPAPPPVPPPRALSPKIVGLDVTGSLPVAVVRRAIERLLPAMRTCTVTEPDVVAVQFSIGDNRRANSAHVFSSGSVAACIVGALGALRTEAAPDVGEVAVVLRVGFE